MTALSSVLSPCPVGLMKYTQQCTRVSCSKAWPTTLAHREGLAHGTRQHTQTHWHPTHRP